MRRSWKAALAAAAIALLAAGAIATVILEEGHPSPGAPAGACPDCNVVLIVMDALRPDHLGCYGYPGGTSPRIDAFAAGALRFGTVVSTSSWTKPAVMSILTGRYPAGHGVLEMRDVMPEGELTLQGTLASRRYAFAGFVSNRVFHEDVVRGFVRIAGEVRAEKGFKVGSPATTDAVVGHLGGIGETKSFLYVHYMDTHVPYFTDGDSAGDDPILRYDEAIRINDGQVGRLLDTLRERGLWDRSIVILTADHGEAFGEHGWHGHYNSLHDEEIRVPFILRAPGVAPGVAEGVFSLADVRPTLHSLLGLPIPEGLDGIDMLSGKRQLAISEMKKGDVHLVSARTAGHKLILDRRSGGRACFDLAADPGEKEPLAGGAGAACLGLEGAVDAYVLRGATGRAGKRAFSAQEREQLRALGYVDGDGGR